MQRKPRCEVDVSIDLRLSGRRAVAQAIVRRAEVRAALDHLARERLAGRVGVVARVGRSAAGCGAQQGGSGSRGSCA